MSDADAAAVLDFWFEDAGESRWFAKDDAFDAEIAERFGDLYDAVLRDDRAGWRAHAEGALAEVIVLDQFSRNLFRDRPEAFAQDDRALATTEHAIAEGFLHGLDPLGRRFLLMPFMHAEKLEVQERGVALFATEGDEKTLDFARRHRDIIARFGRFPHRNAILGRESTAEEQAFLKEPGSSF